MEVDEAGSDYETGSVDDSVRLGRGQVGGQSGNPTCRNGDIVLALSAGSGVYQVAALDQEIVDCYNEAPFLVGTAAEHPPLTFYQDRLGVGLTTAS
jgi:hypothetical protein